MISMIIGLIM